MKNNDKIIISNIPIMDYDNPVNRATMSYREYEDLVRAGYEIVSCKKVDNDDVLVEFREPVNDLKESGVRR